MSHSTVIVGYESFDRGLFVHSVWHVHQIEVGIRKTCETHETRELCEHDRMGNIEIA
jgi:uncharacterized phage-like protein YoqJ